MALPTQGEPQIREGLRLLRLSGLELSAEAGDAEIRSLVSRFQRQQKLADTGLFDSATLVALREAFAGQATGPDLSTSVRDVGARLGGAPLTAGQIAEDLFRRHDYVDGVGEVMGREGTVEGEARRFDEWLDDVRALYLPQEEGQLDGRKVIAGLAMVDEEFRLRLVKGDVLEKVERGIVDFDDELSALGHAHRLEDLAPTVSDRAAMIDELERSPFARLLAWQLRDEYERTKGQPEGADSFMVLLEGPWGSGKSTLLNLLEAELERQEPPWLVARFSAWRHQNVGPPWWLIVKIVYRAALHAPSIKFRERAALWLENLAWRVRLARNALITAGVTLAVLLLLAFSGKLSSDDPIGLLIGLLGAVAGIIGSIRGFTSALTVASSRPEAFMGSTRDPMGVLRRRYTQLAYRITRRMTRPLVVFVDDLDRCRSDYVVALLEGIQTTLRDAPVSYVVAADRRWFYDSYRKVYEGHDSFDTDPGRPLGHLFLEKSFQLSATVPPLGPTRRSTFLRRLSADEESVADVHNRQTHARTAARLVAGDAEFARREQAISRLTTASETAAAEHYLSRFADLLEPNPRAIKRLLNTYRPALAVEILEGRGRFDPREKDQFVLWLIVNLRWPLLAEYLEERPDAADELTAAGRAVPAAIAADPRTYLARLAADPSVRQVFRGEGVAAPLDTAALRRLRSEHGST